MSPVFVPWWGRGEEGATAGICREWGDDSKAGLVGQCRVFGSFFFFLAEVSARHQRGLLTDTDVVGNTSLSL